MTRLILLLCLCLTSGFAADLDRLWFASSMHDLVKLCPDGQIKVDQLDRAYQSWATVLHVGTIPIHEGLKMYGFEVIKEGDQEYIRGCPNYQTQFSSQYPGVVGLLEK